MHARPLGEDSLLDSIPLAVFVHDLHAQLDHRLRAVCALLLALARTFQLLNLAPLHWSTGAPTVTDATLRSLVALATCSDGRDDDRHSSLLLQILDARFLHPAPFLAGLRTHGPAAILNRSVANAFL